MLIPKLIVERLILDIANVDAYTSGLLVAQPKVGDDVYGPIVASGNQVKPAAK